MSNILEELSFLRRQDAEQASKARPLAVLMRQIEDLPPAADFCAPFTADGINVIAELKKASPSEGLIRADFDPVAIAADYAANGAASISVLCEPHRFLGSEDYLRAVHAAVPTPLLYKDFLTTEYQVAAARVAGASASLLIAAVLKQDDLARLLQFAHEVGLTALVETHTLDEVKCAADVGARLVGVNCRDLRTFQTDPNLTAELVAQIPSELIKIGESGLKTHADILKVKAAGANGFLIGTTLMRAPSPGEKLRELRGI